MQTRSLKRIQQPQKTSAEVEREESPLTELSDSDDQPVDPPKKRRRKSTGKVVQPVVNDIPPVVSKTTTFRGISPPKKNIFLRLTIYMFLLQGDWDM